MTSLSARSRRDLRPLVPYDAPMSLEVVFLDIGGVLYDDGVYRDALLGALRELRPDISGRAFAEAYDECRRDQDGSFKERLARIFIGPDADVDDVERRASRYWQYPTGSLEPDVVPCLERLHDRYRLGVLANQPSVVRHAMARDGIDRFFDVWAVSEDLGIDKPDPRIFAHAVEVAGVEPGRAAMVGDRLDYDVRPAKTAGMLAVWVLRGEAPDEPTAEQVAEADATVRTLDELPEVLEEFERR
jgi:putative hydrolase of the HAD superfamily